MGRVANRAPGPIHEAVMAAIREMVAAEVGRSAGTMGTVVGMDGGKPVVHLDGERQARSVGFPRRKGQRYAVGDRVKLSRTATGGYVVDGSVGAGQGEEERVVGGADIKLGGILRENIGRGAVGPDEIGERAVRRDRIEKKAVGRDELDAGAVTNDHVAGGIDGAKLGEGTTGKSKLTAAFQTELATYTTEAEVTAMLGAYATDAELAAGLEGKAPANHGHDSQEVRTTMGGKSGHLDGVLNALGVWITFVCNGQAGDRQIECRCRLEAVTTGNPGKRC